MYIGLVIYGSLDEVSGGYRYDRELVEYLRASGDRVDVIALPHGTYARHLCDNLSVGLFHQLAGTPFDLLLQDELNHPSLFQLNRQLRAAISYPLVTIVHHLRSSEARPAWQKRLYAWIERAYLETVDGFICNSRTTRASVARLVPLRDASLVAYPGRAADEPDAARTPGAVRTPDASTPGSGPLRIAFVGNVVARKGLHTLLAALARLPRAQFSLDVIGRLGPEPAYVRALRAQIARSGLQAQVTLHGYLPDEILAERLAHCHVLAMPSSYEGFGIAYLDGMRFGLPAIGSTAGAAGEVIAHGRTGFLVDPGDDAALAAHLAALYDDRDLLARLSTAARYRYAVHPTWHESAARIRGFLALFTQEIDLSPLRAGTRARTA